MAVAIILSPPKKEKEGEGTQPSDSKEKEKEEEGALCFHSERGRNDFLMGGRAEPSSSSFFQARKGGRLCAFLSCFNGVIMVYLSLPAFLPFTLHRNNSPFLCSQLGNKNKKKPEGKVRPQNSPQFEVAPRLVA